MLSIDFCGVCFILNFSVSPKSQPSSLQPLKESISVLFIFTRRVLDDSQFQVDIHLWLQRLVKTPNNQLMNGEIAILKIT